METLTILLIIILILAIYTVSIYNQLQKLQTQIEASIQEIGNQLKRQANLIPNLQSAVKGYLKQEQKIFTMLTEARQAVKQAEQSNQIQDVEEAINDIQKLVPQLQIMVEDNPEIKSDQTVAKFMNELTDTADKLAYARRSVIDLTQAYNQRLVTFPSNVVANIFGFQRQTGLETPKSGEHLTVSEKETKSPKVDLN